MEQSMEREKGSGEGKRGRGEKGRRAERGGEWREERGGVEKGGEWNEAWRGKVEQKEEREGGAKRGEGRKAERGGEWRGNESGEGRVERAGGVKKANPSIQ